jgi:hypothetical protein
MVYSKGFAKRLYYFKNASCQNDEQKIHEEEEERPAYRSGSNLIPFFSLFCLVLLAATISLDSGSLPLAAVSPTLFSPSSAATRSLDVVVSYYEEDLTECRQGLDFIRSIPIFLRRRSRFIVYNKGQRRESILRAALGLSDRDKVIQLENVGREGATYLRVSFSFDSSLARAVPKMTSSSRPKHILLNYHETVEMLSGTPPETSTSAVSSPQSDLADHTIFLQGHLAWTRISKLRLATVPSDVGFASFGPIRVATEEEDPDHGTYPLLATVYNIFRGRPSPRQIVIAWSGQHIASRKRILANDFAAYKELDDMIEAPLGSWLHNVSVLSQAEKSLTLLN